MSKSGLSCFISQLGDCMTWHVVCLQEAFKRFENLEIPGGHVALLDEDILVDPPEREGRRTWRRVAGDKSWIAPREQGVSSGLPVLFRGNDASGCLGRLIAGVWQRSCGSCWHVSDSSQRWCFGYGQEETNFLRSSMDSEWSCGMGESCWWLWRVWC